jgi:hypothetical protein
MIIIIIIIVPIVLKSASLKLLEPSGPVKGCNGIALPSRGKWLAVTIRLYRLLFFGE